MALTTTQGRYKVARFKAFKNFRQKGMSREKLAKS